MGESSLARCRGWLDERAVHETDGIEFCVGARYFGAYLRGGMDLAGAVSGALAGFAAGCFGVCGCGQFAREVGGAGEAVARICGQADAGRFESRDGIQDLEIWRL